MTYTPAQFALGTELIELAESYAETYYGVSLDALDTEDLEEACQAVTEDTLDDLAEGLAEAAYRRSVWA